MHIVWWRLSYASTPLCRAFLTALRGELRHRHQRLRSGRLLAIGRASAGGEAMAWWAWWGINQGWKPLWYWNAMGKFGHLLLNIMEQLAVVKDLSNMIYIFHGHISWLCWITRGIQRAHRMMIVTKQQCWALGNDMVMTIYDNLKSGNRG